MNTTTQQTRAVAKRPAGELALSLRPECVVVPPPPKRQKVVDEDSYVEGMDKIIQRDFFPDLPKLKLGLEYMEALETDDVRKQREIELKLQEAAAKKLETPSTTCEDQQPTEAKAAVDTNLNLDKYLGKYNSEDNADFEKLTAKAETRRRNRAQWLEETARQNEALLQIASGHDSVQLLTWKYEPKNQLFYTPPTALPTVKELEDVAGGAPKEIVHANTRIVGKVHYSAPNPEEATQSTVYDMLTTSEQTIGERRRKQDGPVNLDDLVQTKRTPNVGGYSFVATPSPFVGDSPITTWGTLACTPLRLDPTDTPLDLKPGPTFKVPDPPAREKVAMALAEKAQKSRLRTQGKTTAPGTPHFGQLSSAGSSLMSRLGKTIATDPQLRASYRSPLLGTPTPTLGTPVSSSSAIKTPSILVPTPRQAPTPRVSGATTPKVP